MENKLSNSILELEALLDTASSILITATTSIGDGIQKDNLIYGARRLVEDANNLAENMDDCINSLCKSAKDAADVLY